MRISDWSSDVCSSDLLGRGALVSGVGLAQGLGTIQHHVLDHVQNLLIDVLIHAQLPGVDNAHRHTLLDGVIQEYRVYRFAHGFVATEGEADVGDAARHPRMGQVLSDPTGRLDKIDGVMVVFVDAGGNVEHIGIETNVFRRKTHRSDAHTSELQSLMSNSYAVVCL